MDNCSKNSLIYEIFQDEFPVRCSKDEESEIKRDEDRVRLLCPRYITVSLYLHLALSNQNNISYNLIN